MLKNMRLVILLHMFLNPSFKANIARTTFSTTQVNLYKRKDFRSSRIGFLFEKIFLILDEVKTSLMLKISLQNFFQSFESTFLIS